ncbi:N-formylglutamate amidohydrolase [Pyruvatibacter mobilis]|jgi:N-formylglutamate amidohydrolase|uniref:N-formylglutamate amidohydrolase n=1 Tax=Pyruvatibacter mobilis TaxID=1712261 RepID=UPI003D0DD13E
MARHRGDDRKAGAAAKAASHKDFTPPFTVARPETQTVPFVLNSPHSGRIYPQAFLAASRLDALSIRRSEDSFVDEIFAAAPRLGAPLLHANFPRAYLDTNREPYELDPAMFHDTLPPHANTRSVRVAGGLGTIARVVADSTEIYRAPLSYAEADHRIRTLYMPYHQALSELLENTFHRFGCAVLIDCHSMPSLAGPIEDDPMAPRADIVLGDRYGVSAAPALTDAAERILTDLGYVVTRNTPYAGGFNTEHYGRPAHGLHALQIEINRALYMDETRVTRGRGIHKLTRDMSEFVTRLALVDRAFLAPTVPPTALSAE